MTLSARGLFLCSVCLATGLAGPPTVACDKEADVKGPVVRTPAAVGQTDASATSRAPAPKWKPGDPVTVKPDLKTDAPPASESEPTSPKPDDPGTKPDRE